MSMLPGRPPRARTLEIGGTRRPRPWAASHDDGGTPGATPRTIGGGELLEPRGSTRLARAMSATRAADTSTHERASSTTAASSSKRRAGVDEPTHWHRQHLLLRPTCAGDLPTAPSFQPGATVKGARLLDAAVRGAAERTRPARFRRTVRLEDLARPSGIVTPPIRASALGARPFDGGDRARARPGSRGHRTPRPSGRSTCRTVRAEAGATTRPADHHVDAAAPRSGRTRHAGSQLEDGDGRLLTLALAGPPGRICSRASVVTGWGAEVGVDHGPCRPGPWAACRVARTDRSRARRSSRRAYYERDSCLSSRIPTPAPASGASSPGKVSVRPCPARMRLCPAEVPVGGRRARTKLDEPGQTRRQLVGASVRDLGRRRGRPRHGSRSPGRRRFRKRPRRARPRPAARLALEASPGGSTVGELDTRRGCSRGRQRAEHLEPLERSTDAGAPAGWAASRRCRCRPAGPARPMALEPGDHVEGGRLAVPFGPISP